MASLQGDIKLGLRQLRTQRGHSAVVIATLGLALGLSAVIFSFVNFFLLRPLPVRDESTPHGAALLSPRTSSTTE